MTSHLTSLKYVVLLNRTFLNRSPPLFDDSDARVLARSVAHEEQRVETKAVNRRWKERR